MAAILDPKWRPYKSYIFQYMLSFVNYLFQSITSVKVVHINVMKTHTASTMMGDTVVSVNLVGMVTDSVVNVSTIMSQ